jgi:hypothetical protein
LIYPRIYEGQTLEFEEIEHEVGITRPHLSRGSAEAGPRWQLGVQLGHPADISFIGRKRSPLFHLASKEFFPSWDYIDGI